MRDGEDDMIMLAGQQPRLLAGHPTLDLHPGTLGAHPVPTGVVPDSLQMLVRAGLDMTTQLRGATRQDRPHRPPHIVMQRSITSHAHTTSPAIAGQSNAALHLHRGAVQRSACPTPTALPGVRCKRWLGDRRLWRGWWYTSWPHQHECP